MNDSHVAIQALGRQRIGLPKRLHDDTIDLQKVTASRV